MLALDRKLLRDLWHVRSQALAIAAVMASGVAMFVMAIGALVSLSGSQQTYYQRYRFADVFAPLKRAPLHLADRIRELPGVTTVYPRIVAAVSLDIPDMREPAIGRLISLPEQGEPPLNGVYLRRGRWVDSTRSDEVLVSESFAESHHLQLGDRVAAVINGRKQPLRIVGFCLSPEYIIEIGPGNLLPDHRRFGVFWMSRRQLEAAFDMTGAFNDLAVATSPGTNVDELIKQIDRLLAPYGGIGAYDRSQQTSHQYISDEIRQLSTMALVAPTIFLAVSAFLLNVVMSRLIGLQREQIAALKAFGYGPLAVGWHYLKFVLLISLVGTILGVVFGAYLGANLTRMYAKFYRFPEFQIRLEYRAVVGGVVISVLASSLGALYAVRRAVRLPPAEAMRPESPPRYGPTLLERVGFARLLPQITRMLLRQLERRPARAFTAILGIAMAVAILMMGSFSLDAINYLMHFQFRLTQRQEAMVTLIEPSSPGVVHELGRLPGVIRAQPFRVIPTKIVHGTRSKRVAVTGLESADGLYRLLNTDEQLVEIPEEGLVVSDKLADLLGARLGDPVTLEVLEGKRPVLQTTITRIVTEYGGTNAYMQLAALHRLLQETDVVSGAYLSVSADLQPALFQTLKNTPRVAGAVIKTAMLKSFQDTIAENLLTMRTFNILFSVIIAFGVVYNNARISLSEQSRELATLRVIGFSRGEVSGILLGELAILTIAAIPLGWLIGYGLVAAFVQGLDTEAFRIPLVIDRTTYAMAAAVVILAAFLSGLIVRRRIDQLDLVSVLKTRE